MLEFFDLVVRFWPIIGALCGGIYWLGVIHNRINRTEALIDHHIKESTDRYNNIMHRIDGIFKIISGGSK